MKKKEDSYRLVEEIDSMEPVPTPKLQPEEEKKEAPHIVDEFFKNFKNLPLTPSTPTFSSTLLLSNNDTDDYEAVKYVGKYVIVCRNRRDGRPPLLQVLQGGKVRKEIKLRQNGSCILVVDEDTLIVGEWGAWVELVSISQAKVLHSIKEKLWCNCIERVKNMFIAGFIDGSIRVYEVLQGQIKKVFEKHLC
jgi:hypothetical protein